MKPKQPTVVDDDQPPNSGRAKAGSFFMASNQEAGLQETSPYPLPTPKDTLQPIKTAPVLKNIEFQIIDQLEKCQQLWAEFSPQKTIFDTWSFRYAFWLGYQHKPHFIVLSQASENLALLPLWYESDRQKYFWFGSWWQEENSLMTKNELLLPLLLEICPTPAELNALHTQIPAWFLKTAPLEADDPKFVLNLEELDSVDGFLARFNKKKRYNLRRDQRLVENRNPQIFFDRFEDFEQLVKISKKRFAQKGESTDWEDPRRIETFRQVIKLGFQEKEYKVRMISVEIDNKLAAVDLIAIFKNCYYPLKCGYDVGSFPGIGNYTNLLEIEDALSLGMKKMDFLEIGYGWKDKWFEPVSLYKYNKGL